MKLYFLHKKAIVIPFLAGFGNDQSSICTKGEGKNIIIDPLDWISFEAAKTLQLQYKKPINKNTQTLFQQSAILNDSDITNNDDPIEKTLPQNGDVFSPDLLSKKNPSTSEKYNDCENENLQLQTIHETYTSLVKQSFFDPSFFFITPNFNEFFYLLILHWQLKHYWNTKNDILFWKMYINRSLKIHVLL